MAIVVVSTDPQERWALVSALGLPASAALAPEMARSLVSHPSQVGREVIVVATHEPRDVAWVDWHRSASTHRDVGLVALADDEDIAAAADNAGADEVVLHGDTADATIRELRAAIERVSQVVTIRLDDPSRAFPA